MPEQAQTINVSPFAISPVQLKPVADILLITPGRSSTIQYIIGKLCVGKPAVPAVPGIVGRGAILAVGKPGDANYQPFVPAIDGRPDIPEVPAIPDKIVPIEQGTIEMSDDEWTAWKSDTDDQAYRAAIVAKRLSLSLVKSA